MQLADEARRRACGLARMEQRVLGALERRLGLERRVQRLDDALHVQEAAFGDPGDAEPLVRQLAVCREVDARDLEQRDRARARVDVPAGRVDEARQERRPQRGQLDRDRLGQLPRRLVVRTQARRVRLGEAEADEGVLDPAAQLLLARQPAEHLAPRGQRVRHVLEPEARDLLDHVDLARDVARAPGRDDDVLVAALEAELARAGGTAARAASRPRSARRRARGGSARPGARGQARVHVGVRDPARRPRARAGATSRARRRARRGTGRRPSPSGSSPRCAGGGARRSGRCRAARSSPPRAGRSSSASPISVSSPPMIPASAIARSASAITRSSGTSSRSTPSRVRSRSPGAARRTTISPPASVAKSNAWSGFPSASIT